MLTRFGAPCAALMTIMMAIAAHAGGQDDAAPASRQFGDIIDRCRLIADGGDPAPAAGAAMVKALVASYAKERLYSADQTDAFEKLLVAIEPKCARTIHLRDHTAGDTPIDRIDRPALPMAGMPPRRAPPQGASDTQQTATQTSATILKHFGEGAPGRKGMLESSRPRAFGNPSPSARSLSDPPLVVAEAIKPQLNPRSATIQDDQAAGAEDQTTSDPQAAGASENLPTTARPASGERALQPAEHLGSLQAGSHLEAFFPWPPPQPFIDYVVPAARFRGIRDLGQVSDRLEDSLDRAGYSGFRYFAVGDDGFALVTRMEQVDAAGSPLGDEHRWDDVYEGKPAYFGWDLRDYLVALFHRQLGHFRVFVFIVSKENVAFSDTATLDAKTALLWQSRGSELLPRTLSTLTFTGDYHVLVLEYQFETEEGVGPHATRNGSAADHLKHARILQD